MLRQVSKSGNFHDNQYLTKGEHNVAGEADPAGYLREDLEDALLTDWGRNQCSEMRLLPSTSLASNAKLVIVSPMNRTLQTATYCFGDYLRCQWLALECIREQVALPLC